MHYIAGRLAALGLQRNAVDFFDRQAHEQPDAMGNLELHLCKGLELRFPIPFNLDGVSKSPVRRAFENLVNDFIVHVRLPR